MAWRMSTARELHPAFDPLSQALSDISRRGHQLEVVEREQLVATLQRLRDTLPAIVQKPRKKRGN